MKTVRIFISSPGDVEQERERARQVIEGLRRRYAREFHLAPVFWENLPLEPDMSFQQGIDLFLKNPGVDIAVFILWSRLGSPLGATIRKADGALYRSGTEREFDLMIQARAQSRKKEGTARPRMIVYTRQDQSSFDARLRGKTTAEQMEMLSQKELVESFMKETFRDAETGANVGAYHPFDRPVTFSQRLRVHLQALLDEMAGDMDEVIWDVERQGPPFVGLEAFQARHADVFFGREEEILEARQALKQQEREGCAFLLLAGPSGSGKSSLARAGLVPEIVENEVDEQIEEWRTLVVTPSELGADPTLGLVTKLAEAGVLEELRGQVLSLEELAKDLVKEPEMAFRHTVRKALEAAAVKRHGGVRLLLVVDQLEELFTREEGSGANGAFLAVIEAFARSGLAWVVATARSDFYQELQRESALVRMKEGRGLLDVRAPGADALQRVIEEPARRAGLSFETRGGQSLASLILKDAARYAELLPLVEFVLTKLFEQRSADRVLTFAAYESLGGVEGSLARTAEETYAGLPLEAKDLLGRVLQAVVTVGDADGEKGEEKVVRQHAALAMFGESAERTCVNRFVSARLFTTGKDAMGEATVTVAHEALLRVWPRAMEWRALNAEYLRTRARVMARLKEGSPLLEGDPLLEAAVRQVAGDPSGFSREAKAFIEQCREVVARRKERRARVRRVVTGALAALTVLSLAAAAWAWMKQGEATSQRNVAETQARLAKDKGDEAQRNLDEAERQLERSALEEGRAWLERAKVAQAERNPMLAALLAGRAMGFRGYGWTTEDERTFGDVFRPLLSAQLVRNPQLQPQRLSEVRAARKLISELNPLGLPIWSSPVKAQHAESVGCVAVSRDGTRVASGSSDNTVKLWEMATGKEVSTLQGHTEWVTSVAFSPDGTHLVSGSWDTTVKLWEVASGKAVATLKGHDVYITSVAFSPDGTLVASGSEDKSVRLWEVATGKDRAVLKGHTYGVRSVAFSPDGARVASGSGDEVKHWDVASGRLVATFPKLGNGVTSIAFSPDGTRLAVGGLKVKLLEVKSGKETATLQGHGDKVSSVAFSPDGTRIASGSDDKTIKLWETATGNETATLHGHSNVVTGVAFNSNGDRVVSSSADRSLKVWDVATARELGKVHGHGAQITDVAFSPDGTWVASGSQDGTVKVWEVTTGREVATLQSKNTTLAFSPDGTRLALGSGRMWEAATGREMAPLEGNFRDAISVAFSPDGTRLASGCWDKTVKIREISTGSVVATLEGHTFGVMSVAFSPDGNRIASASWDRTVKLWDVATGKVTATFRGQLGERNTIAFSSDGMRLASVAQNNTVKLWQADSGVEVTTLKGEGHTVACVAFSPDGSRIASGSRDNDVKLWEAATGREIATLRGHGGGVTCIAFSPDGTRVVTGSEDHTVRLWEVGAGKELATLRTNGAKITCGMFNLSGTRFATGSEEGVLRIWEVSTSKELATLKGHTQHITGVTFSPNGARLASASRDSTVRLWNGITGKEMATIERNTWFGSMAFSRDGGLLAICDGHKVKLSDGATGQEVDTLHGHRELVNCVVFSPNGSLLASGSDDKTIKLWQVPGGNSAKRWWSNVPFSLDGHGKRVTALAFSPDGTRLASGSADETIKLWDLTAMREMTAFSGYRDEMRLAFSADGTQLISGSDDNDVTFWELTTHKEMVNEAGWPRMYGFSSPDGKWTWSQGSGDSEIVITPIQEHPLDLLHFQREGLIHLAGRQSMWPTNPSLLTSRAFTPLHYRHDEVFDLSKPGVAGPHRTLLHLRLLAKGNQWRAAMVYWRTLSEPEEEARRLYVGFLLVQAKQMIETGQSFGLGDLLAELGNYLTAGDCSRMPVTLPLVSLLAELSTANAPEIAAAAKKLHHAILEEKPTIETTSLLKTLAALLRQKPEVKPAEALPK